MVDKRIFGVTISRTCLVFLNIVIIIADNIVQESKNEKIPAGETSFSTAPNTDYNKFRRENPALIADMDISDIKSYFNQFNDFFKISYQNHKLKDKYFKTFEENVKRYSVMNKFTTSAKFRINEFSHLTLSEFTEWYTGFNDTYDDDKIVKDFREIDIYTSNSSEYEDATRTSKHKADKKSKKPKIDSLNQMTTKAIPISLDLRALGLPNSLKNQGLCRMSYVSSAIANIEAQCAKDFARHLKLSHIQGFGCEPKGSCKYGGMPHHVLEGIKRAGGAILEQDYYIRKDQRNQKICHANASLVKVKIHKVLRMSVGGEDNLLKAFMKFGPLITAIHVSESVKNYHSGVLAPTDCDAKPNHAVLLIGYGKTKSTNVPYWIIQNSWGKRWGENGYMRLLRGENACNIGSYVATAVVKNYGRQSGNAVPKIFQLPERNSKADKTLAMGNYGKKTNFNNTLFTEDKTRTGRHKKNEKTHEKTHNIVYSRQNTTAMAQTKGNNINRNDKRHNKKPRIPKIVFVDSSDDGTKGVQTTRLGKGPKDTSNEASGSAETEALVTKKLEPHRYIQSYYT